MNLMHKCLLAIIILLTGLSAAWATGKLQPGFGSIYSQFDAPTAGVTADTAIYAVPAFVQCIWFSQADAAPTAGAIDFYDNASAASGTKIFTHTFTTSTFMPFPFCPQSNMTNGLYVDVNMSDIVVTVVGKK